MMWIWFYIWFECCLYDSLQEIGNFLEAAANVFQWITFYFCFLSIIRLIWFCWKNVRKIFWFIGFRTLFEISRRQQWSLEFSQHLFNFTFHDNLNVCLKKNNMVKLNQLWAVFLWSHLLKGIPGTSHWC